MRLRSRVPFALTATLAAVLLAACGSGNSGAGAGKAQNRATPEEPGDHRAELEHIHGLGIDPRSGNLYVATHFGLFMAAKGEVRLRRMGAGRQDIMGFSVVGPRHFVGSGHPAANQNLPPSLGLIESRDGGGSWKNISLLGRADFHVLRSAGRHVYGFDSGSGRLMVSTNAGRDWRQRTPPASMFDLAIDPTDRERIVVSTERGTFVSANAGRGWRPLRDDLAGLLAWPAADRLFLVDGQGQVSRSGDGGKTFRAAGSIGAQPAAFVSYRSDLYAARPDGSVVRSTDGGASWAVRATP